MKLRTKQNTRLFDLRQSNIQCFEVRVGHEY